MAFYAGFITLIFLCYFIHTMVEHNEYWLYLFICIMESTLIYSISILLYHFGCLL